MKNSFTEIQNKSERIDTTEHFDEYVEYFFTLNLDSVPQRDIFITKVVDHLEPQIKKIIKNEITKNQEYYTPLWRTLVIKGKKPYEIKVQLGEIVVSHHSFSSFNPLQNQLDSYSLIKNFIEYHKNKNYGKKLKLFYDKRERNLVGHDGSLTTETEELKKIQPCIGDFMQSIMDMFKESLEYGRLTTKKNLKKYFKIIELQKTELKNSDEKIYKLDSSLKQDKNEFQNHFKILKRKYGIN